MKHRTKPANWRTYSWYRPPSFSAVPGNGRATDEAYIDWLAKARGWPHAEAHAYAHAMDRRTIISQTTAAEGPTGETPSHARKPAARPSNVVALVPPPRERSEVERRQDAAALLREIAEQYGPRRAHKLRAMAVFLVGANMESSSQLPRSSSA